VPTYPARPGRSAACNAAPQTRDRHELGLGRSRLSDAPRRKAVALHRSRIDMMVESGELKSKHTADEYFADEIRPYVVK
jgi:hypothetical protein